MIKTQIIVNNGTTGYHMYGLQKCNLISFLDVKLLNPLPPNFIDYVDAVLHVMVCWFSNVSQRSRTIFDFFYNITYSSPHFFYFHIFIYTKYCTVHVGLCKCRIMGKLWKCPWQCVDKGYDGIEKCPLWCVDEDYDCSNVDVIDPCHTYVYVCRIIINTKFETPGMSVSNQWNVRSIGLEFIVSLINILHDVKCRRLNIWNITLTACLNPVKWMKDSEKETLNEHNLPWNVHPWEKSNRIFCFPFIFSNLF